MRNPGIDITVFKCGIPISALKENWTSLLLIIQKFITCEGRYGSMYMYHIRLLMNFMENQTIDLHYFLLSSLKKMSIQNNLDDVEPHLYHHDLIKIIIEKKLKERKDTWERFLIRNFFQDPPETPESSSTRKSRRIKTNVNIQDTPTSRTKETSKEEMLSETLIEVREQVKEKGKINFEDIYRAPEPSSEEGQILSERLIHLKE